MVVVVEGKQLLKVYLVFILLCLEDHGHCHRSFFCIAEGAATPKDVSVGGAIISFSLHIFDGKSFRVILLKSVLWSLGEFKKRKLLV